MRTVQSDKYTFYILLTINFKGNMLILFIMKIELHNYICTLYMLCKVKYASFWSTTNLSRCVVYFALEFLQKFIRWTNAFTCCVFLKFNQITFQHFERVLNTTDLPMYNWKQKTEMFKFFSISISLWHSNLFWSIVRFITKFEQF